MSTCRRVHTDAEDVRAEEEETEHPILQTAFQEQECLGFLALAFPFDLSIAVNETWGYVNVG